MPGCNCENSANQLTSNKDRRRTLVIVLIINAVMFVAVLAAGLWADSRALMADSADNLGDAMVYALSLVAISRSTRWKAGAAMIKGIVQLAFAVLIIVYIMRSIMGQPEPIGLAIMGMAALALVANLVCFALLLKHRDEDINMKSVWLCSRNDVISNAGVIAAGALVIWFNSFWPDVLVASLIAILFLHTAYVVLRDATRAWRDETTVTATLSN